MYQPAGTLSLSSAASAATGALRRAAAVRTTPSRSAARAARPPSALFGFGKAKEAAETGDEYTVTYCSNW